MLEHEDLKIIHELVKAHHDQFSSYLSDPMMEGQPQEYFDAARREVERVKPVLEKLRGLLA